MRKRFVLALMLFGLVFGSSFALTPAYATTLKESIDTAINNNPAVQSAQSKLEAARAKVAQSVSSFFPAFSANASYGDSYAQPSTTQITIVTTQGAQQQTFIIGTDDKAINKNISLGLTQQLDISGRLWVGLQSASKARDIAAEELRRVKQDITYNTISAYLGVLKSNRVVQFSKESLDMSQKQTNQIQAKLDSGLATKADLLRAQVQLANAQVELTQAQNGFEISKNIFNNALAVDINSPVDLTESDFDDSTLPKDALAKENDFQAAAFKSRPEWKQFELNKGLANDAVMLAYSNYFPYVSGSASSGNSITEYPQYKNDTNSWRWQVGGSWSLDNIGPSLRVREAAENLNAVKANEETVRRNIILDVRNALFELKSAQESLPGAKTAVDLADENYAASVVRFEAGAQTNLEMLDAQVSLTHAKLNYLQARYDLELAKAKINKVCGIEVL